MKPISNTAFYCCGVRMQDAENPKSICQDIYAKDFMDARGLAILAILSKAIEYGSVKVPVFIFKLFLKTLQHGYAIYTFEAGY